MKRKSEVVHQIEAKIPSLSPFLKEEALDVQDIDKDVDDFLDCYNKFVKYVTEIYDKKEKTSAAKASHFILKFKELNRKAQFRLSISREKTKETKDAINKSHLTMQNLLYEALHLEKETNSCLEYKSLHEEIDLVSVDQFSSQAPAHLQSAVTEHDMTLSRLHWELCERKNLSTQIEEAERAEERLLEEISKKKQAYSDISVQLRCVLNSTESLEDIFDMPMHRQESQNAMAESLPESLYVLYTNLRVHADSDNSAIKVTLVDEETHGACVLVDMTEADTKLSLGFQWHETMALMTVQPRLEATRTQDLTLLTSCVVDPSLLLSELPGDHGSPFNLASIRAKINYVSSLLTGVPYVWCQRLWGSFADTSISEHRPLVQLFADIRHRLRSRIQLVGELNSLFNPKYHSSSSLTTEWSLSSFAKFKAAPEDTATFIGSGLASEQCFYYSAIVRSSKYEGTIMSLWFVVPHSYPDKHSLVVLSKTGADNTVCGDGTLKHALHLIEVEVNCYCHELAHGLVLSGQATRLFSAIQSLFDYQHAPMDKTKSLFIGGKFPATKRPFKSS